jgi:hypothetical protein
MMLPVQLEPVAARRTRAATWAQPPRAALERWDLPAAPALWCCQELALRAKPRRVPLAPVQLRAAHLMAAQLMAAQPEQQLVAA